MEDTAIIARGGVPLTYLDDGPRVDTRVIAARLDNDHRNVMELIARFEDEFGEFGLLRFETAKGTGGRPGRYALLNEDQAYLLLTYSRNSDSARSCKRALVHAFKQARERFTEQLSPLDALERIVAVMREQSSRITRVEASQAALEHLVDTAPVPVSRLNEVHTLGQQYGQLLGNYRKAWGYFNQQFGLPSYRDLRNYQYEDAVAWLRERITQLGGTVGLELN